MQVDPGDWPHKIQGSGDRAGGQLQGLPLWGSEGAELLCRKENAENVCGRGAQAGRGGRAGAPKQEALTTSGCRDRDSLGRGPPRAAGCPVYTLGPLGQPELEAEFLTS